MGLSPLNVSVSFNEYPIITKENRTTVGRRLAELVTLCMPEGDGFRSFHPDGSCEEDLPFHSIRLIRFPRLSQPHWSVATAGFVAEEFSELVQETILKKSLRASDYREKCESCWLLVVVSGFGPSSFFSASEKTATHVYESQFDETFYLEIRSNRLICLQTQKTLRETHGAIVLV
jgi:hypothetical protein